MKPFENLVKENRELFMCKIEHICNRLGIRVEDLMLTMKFESNINPKAVNPISGATGLIQFMPSTARSLGTTTDQLLKMTNVEQLVYVEKYLKPYIGRMKDWLDVYLAVFYPVLIGKPDSTSITNSAVVRQNPIFDRNKDGVIQKSEIREALKNHIPKEYENIYK